MSTNTMLTIYRVLAWTVGTILIILVLVAMPLKYLAGQPQGVEVIGPIHGWMFMFYVASVIVLGFKTHWGLWRILLTALAGTIPFVSFYAEHKTVQFMRTQPAPQA
jgi:integral membrane protein